MYQSCFYLRQRHGLYEGCKGNGNSWDASTGIGPFTWCHKVM